MAQNIDQYIKQFAEMEAKINALADQLQKKFSIQLDTRSFEQLESSLRNSVGLNSDLVSEQQKLIEAKKTQLSIHNMLLDLTNEQDQATLKQNIENIRSLEILQNQLDVVKNQSLQSENLLKTSLGINDNSLVYFNKSKEILQLSQLTLTAEKQRALQQQFIAATLTRITDGFVKIASTAFNMALDVEKATRNLMLFANFSFEDASRGIREAGVTAAIAGIPLDKLTASMQTLKTEFSGYTSLTASQRDNLNNFAAVMDKIGINATTQAMVFDTTTKSLGLSTTQTVNFLSSLKDFAAETGQSVQQLDKQLSTTIGQLAKYGTEATRVFREMSIASKQLGISVEEMYNITERFTTFEGAAEAAAKLNALLGSDIVNSINLLNASMNDPVEVFREFKGALDQAGISFNDLDNGMRRTIAAAIGMSELQAGKAFSQDINLSTAAMREQIRTTEQLAEVSSKMTAIVDKFKNAMLAFYPVLEPTIDALGRFADFLTENIAPIVRMIDESEGLRATLSFVGTALIVVVGAFSAVGLVVVPLVTTLVSLKVLFGGMAGVAAFASGPISSLGLSLGSTGAAAASSIPGMVTWTTTTATAGTASAVAAPSLWSVGFAILAIGASIAAIIFTMSLLVDSIAKTGDNAIFAVAGIGLLSLGIIGMSYALVNLATIGAPGTLVLLGIGAAALMIGKGIEMATDNIVEMLNSLPSAILVLSDFVDKLDKLDLEKIKEFAKIKVISVTPAGQGITIPVTGAQSTVAPQPTPVNAGIQAVSATTTPVNLQITIDSPVMINGREVGRIAENKTIDVFSSIRTGNIVPALS